MWKTIDDISDILKVRMKDEARKNAQSRFLYRYGIYLEDDFSVDELRRFTKYTPAWERQPRIWQC